MAAYRAIPRAKEVLPIPGREAMIIRSDSCSPDVFLSKSIKPVEIPVYFDFFSYRLAI